MAAAEGPSGTVAQVVLSHHGHPPRMSNAELMTGWVRSKVYRGQTLATRAASSDKVSKDPDGGEPCLQNCAHAKDPFLLATLKQRVRARCQRGTGRAEQLLRFD